MHYLLYFSQLIQQQREGKIIKCLSGDKNKPNRRDWAGLFWKLSVEIWGLLCSTDFALPTLHSYQRDDDASLPPSLLLSSKINTGWRLQEKLANASAAKHRPPARTSAAISPSPAWQFPQHLQKLSRSQESCRSGGCLCGPRSTQEMFKKH